MSVECFLDTNVRVYAADSSDASHAKPAAARKLIADKQFGLSSQVLQEFFVVVSRKLQTPLSTEEAIEAVEYFACFPCVAVDSHLVLESITVSKQHQLNYWDAAILAVAVRLGAPLVYSKDLNHGQQYGEVQVLNPFLDALSKS
ncbi:MAG: PIN domain-containing protein [Opitutales bacterium]